MVKRKEQTKSFTSVVGVEKMTKRCGSFEIVNNKKPKFEDLWDDDLDTETIEDCFKLATQICEEDNNAICTQHNNITILPTYNAFRNPKNIFTSTQSVDDASTSKQQHLESRIKQLAEKYEEKEGEVTILRTNLKELKDTQLIENERKQNEWKAKLNCKNKEMEEIRSELEFKNLEIANLKQSVKKRKLTKQSENHQTIPKNDNLDISIYNVNNWKLSTISKAEYPLKNLDLLTIFENLQNYKQNSHINCLYSEILLLTNLQRDEFDRSETIESINKVISIFRNTVKEFQEILKNHKYEINNNCNELGVETGKILYLLSELLLFSDYLYNCLYENDFNELLEILGNLQKKKLGRFCTGFLTSFCKFLKSSIIKNNSNLLLLNKAIKLLLLTVDFDNNEFLTNLCRLFEIASNSFVFAENLCRNTAEKTDCCNFSIFGKLLDAFLNDVELDDLSKDISNCFLNFVHNLFKSNPKWLYLPENSCSNCIKVLCKLSMRLIYKNLEKYKLQRTVEIDFVHTVKILNLLSFNCYDVFEKCLSTFSQYKEIMYNLTNLQHDLQITDYIHDLEQLNIIEEFPTIPTTKFRDIDL